MHFGLKNQFLLILLLLACPQTSCQRLGKGPVAPKRLSSDASSLVIADSIMIERANSGDRLTLTFDTREAASCILGFSAQPVANSRPTLTIPCASSSAMKFSESITGIPKDQLIVVHLKTWPATGSESSGKIINISESIPSADSQTLNLLMVDTAGRRVELTSLQETRGPQDILNSLSIQNSGSCVPGVGSDGILSGNTKASLVQGATFRGLFNSSLTRVSPTTLSGSFQTLQRQSTEWSLTARTLGGFGQLRLAKPVLLKSVIFAGSAQADGLDDGLEDIDPPGLGVLGNSTMVATWVLDGDAKNAKVTLALQPASGFPGVTCRANASDGRMVIPSQLLLKMPTKVRLWASLRVDSWQPLEKERWLVRVSDWSSMGIQRL